MRSTKPAEDRFWYRVKKAGIDECWMWTGGTNGRYGILSRGRVGDGMIYAHRLSFIMSGRALVDGLDVMHSCDTPLCVNPNHLSLGTRKENMSDALKKGRVAWKAHKGASNGRAKLTEENVIEIRSSCASIREMAEKFGVAETLVGRIRLRKAWRHVA